MVTITVSYQGDLHCEAVHEPSGSVIETDAPRDNQGRGEKFSPTDLVATALGTCILTVMGIAARNMQVALRGAKAVVHKEMIAAPTRRIGKLAVKVHVPVRLTDEQRKKLEHAAMTCPVHKSLHPDIDAPVEFSWG